MLKRISNYLMPFAQIAAKRKMRRRALRSCRPIGERLEDRRMLTHFFFGTIGWSADLDVDTSGRTVEFAIDQTWRRSVFAGSAADGSVSVGDTVSVGGLEFGDGTQAALDATVQTVDTAGDSFTATAELAHRYDTAGDFTVAFLPADDHHQIELVSRNNFSLGDDHSEAPSISGNGSEVAFQSLAGNLVSENSIRERDVFVRDRVRGETTRVSVANSGAEANHVSLTPSISDDGRFVAFSSAANNLVGGADDPNVEDIFVHDRVTGEVTLVSVSSDGVAGNGHSQFPSISADGRFVAFRSSASNLADNDTNPEIDIFVHDRQTGETNLVSVNSSGVAGLGRASDPAISADGRFVAFASQAADLVANDTNGREDIFVHDRQTGQTTLVSVSSQGIQGDSFSLSPDLSADGRYVVFHSYATNLVDGDTNAKEDVFLHDRETGETTRLSVDSQGNEANHWSIYPSLSNDGRFVAFVSHATNLVLNDTNNQDDVFVHDRFSGQTSRLSVNELGEEGNSNSGGVSNVKDVSISADGRLVAFASRASNLVDNDYNNRTDVFVADVPGARLQTVVNVEILAPTLTIEGPGQAAEGAIYTLALSNSLPEAVDGWTVNWGDGHIQQISGSPDSATHVYADDGQYLIRASAHDAQQSFAATIDYPTAIEADQPLAYWRLDDASDSVVHNSGVLGSSMDAPVSGDPEATTGLLIDSTDRAAAFDGDGDRILVPNHPQINSAGPYEQRTIEFWFRADDVQRKQVLFEEGGWTRGLNAYLQQGRLYLQGWNTANDDSGSTTPWGPFFVDTEVESDTTYHVALVLDQPNGTLTGYVNGIEIGHVSGVGRFFLHLDRTAIGGVRDYTRFHDGTSSHTPANEFSGVIDEVAIYAQTLAADRVRAHYFAGSSQLIVDNAAPQLRPNLRDWQQEYYTTDIYSWIVDADGRTVLQTTNGEPTVFYSDTDALGQRVQTNIKVETASDDDYIGLVLGFDPGELDLNASQSDIDYLLIDWKQETTSKLLRGLAVSRVKGHVDFDLQLGQREGPVEELARAITLGDRGWDDLTDYELTVEYDAQRLRLFVDGGLELDVTAPPDDPFPAGRFGFYNHSQRDVRYGPIRTDFIEGSEGSVVHVEKSFTDAGILDTHEATIDWGDGTPPESAVVQTAVVDGRIEGTILGNHVYEDNGSYEVTLSLADDDGGNDMETLEIPVANVAPVASVAGPSSVLVGESMTFTLSVNDVSGADQAAGFEYKIDWDGNEVVDQTVNGPDGLAVDHAFSDAGPTTIKVTATDKDGGTSVVASHQIDVIQLVDIDIKPGSDSNPINVGSNGALAVAILSNAGFDATTIDASSVVFAGAHAFNSTLEDVDNDGDLDMLLHFRREETILDDVYAQLVTDDVTDDDVLDSINQIADVSLTGATLAGESFLGIDEVNLFLRGKALRELLDELFV